MNIFDLMLLGASLGISIIAYLKTRENTKCFRKVSQTVIQMGLLLDPGVAQEMLDEGHSEEAVAKAIGISVSQLKRITQRAG